MLVKSHVLRDALLVSCWSYDDFALLKYWFQTKFVLVYLRKTTTDCKKRHTSLAIAWIDYRKAYDMVPHSLFIERLVMFGIAGNVKKFLIDSMQTWKVELTSSGERLGVIHIRTGIFQGNNLLTTNIMRKSTAGYNLAKEFKVNHLLFMDDLKMFGKSEDQIKSLVQTVQLFSENIGMEKNWVEKVWCVDNEKGKASEV